MRSPQPWHQRHVGYLLTRSEGHFTIADLSSVIARRCLFSYAALDHCFWCVMCVWSCSSYFIWICWLIELRFYIPLDTKISHFGDISQANLLVWYGFWICDCTCNMVSIILTMRCYANRVYAVALCQSICRHLVFCHVKGAKYFVTKLAPHGSPGSLVFRHQRSYWNSTEVIANKSSKYRLGK